MLYASLFCALLVPAQLDNVPSDITVQFDFIAWRQNHAEDTEYQYDVLKMITAMQGIVNREEPRLLVRFLRAPGQGGVICVDDYWLEKSNFEQWSGRSLMRTASIGDLFSAFGEEIRGAVVWDPAVPATSNVASTVAGVRDLLPVRHGARLHRSIIESGPELEVKENLVGQFDGGGSGSAKNDAYRWAIDEFLDEGRCNPALMANYIDAYTQLPGQPGMQYPNLDSATIANHDYFIANRAFFFDLSPWGDEAPVDDPGQPLGTDLETMRLMLATQAEQNEGQVFTSIGGFTSWDLKYTNFGAAGGSHEPVATEWQLSATYSAYNAFKDADALSLVSMPNASAYQHFPAKDQYTQNEPPAEQPLENKTYVLIYMGDYDSAAWISRHIPSLWDDPARGQIPIAWAYNPNLIDRIPHVFHHVYKTKTPNDYFMSGPSGAGYLMPNVLIGERMGSGLPDALDSWIKHNERYYTRLDYSITGFVINGFQGDMPLRIQEAYAQFSPNGVGMQLGFEQPIVNGVPFVRHTHDIYPDLNDFGKTAAIIRSFVPSPEPRFAIFRFILQSPSTVIKVRDQLQMDFPDRTWEFVDPYTFFDLYKRHHSGEAPATPEQ